MFTDTVSVNGSDFAIPRHYGSMYTMADYKNTSHNMYFTAGFAATDRLHLHGTVNMNMSTSEYDAVEMPDVTDRLEGDLTHSDLSFDTMPSYSNLEYTILNVQGGFEYLVSSGVTFTAEGVYVDMTDDGGWVYGLETGNFFTLLTGVRIDF